MSAEDSESKRINDEIDMALKKEKMNLRNEVKMLLLGKGLAIPHTILQGQCSL